MAQYATLKAAIDAVIKANGQREITGTVLNQTLNAMVNSLGANYQLAGVATPSTNPGTPDQNVFYLAFEAGTYTNFNATVLSAGISILMWNGSWSSQTFYTIDATPTASSNNLVSSGAVFDAIKTDGSAYDVSAHFPTAGPNNDGKFTLEYILSNANTLIPAAWRKGGMSIRFVQSSDNKYVQYRCKSQSFSTNVDDWSYESDDALVDNPEYIKAITDNEGHLLAWIRVDGGIDWAIGVPQPVIDYITEKISELSLDEYEDIVTFLGNLINGDKTLATLLDEKANVTDVNTALNTKVDKVEGKSLSTNDFTNTDKELVGVNEIVDNPEYIKTEVDSEGKILSGRTSDGAAFEVVGFSTPKISVDNTTVNHIDDPEKRLKIETDANGKVISYRDKGGVLHEIAGIETSQINLVEHGLGKLMSDLKNGGFLAAVHDWSEEKFVEIPLPNVCSIVNIVSNSSIPKLDQSVDGYIEYWDKLGNYFKKPITGFAVQGDSSKAMPEKNYKFDLDDGSSIKFGDWVPQDSFHLKKYYMDNFRGQCVVAYRLAEQMYQTRDFGNRKPYEYLYANNSTQDGNGKMSEDFFTGALCHPDGFPIKLYYNGELVGIYSFNLKKHRDNYAMSKKNTNNIILDGTLNVNTFWGGTVSWEDFEIRNPKTKKSKDGWELVDINGNTYDGDDPKELMGTTTSGYDSSNTSHKKSADTKAVIERLAGAINAVNAAATINEKKAVYETYFKVDECIDYLIFANVLFDSDGFSKNWIWCTWDGLLWSPTYYDKDSIFGIIPATGVGIHYQSLSLLLGGGDNPTGLLFSLYQTEIETRYKELRDKGVFTTENIVRLLESWVGNVGYDNLKEELEDTCPQTPSYRASNLYDGWVIQSLENKSLPAFDPTKTYQEGERCWYQYMTIIATKEIAPHPSPVEEEYSLYPQGGGFYNSVQRVHNWLQERIAMLDTNFNYNV